jgi:peroxiredoxin
MKKWSMTMLLVVMMATMLQIEGYGAVESESNVQLANVLKRLEIFVGSDRGFELEKELTREESIVLMLKLMGKMKEAENENLVSTFIDVPKGHWANKYIAYAHKINLTSGIGNGQFGLLAPVKTNQFITFVLRIMGYSDQMGEFDWKNPLSKAHELGLIEGSDQDLYQSFINENFVRNHVVKVLYYALKTKNKFDRALLNILVEQKFIEQQRVEDTGDANLIEVLTILWTPTPTKTPISTKIPTPTKTLLPTKAPTGTPTPTPTPTISMAPTTTDAPMGQKEVLSLAFMDFDDQPVKISDHKGKYVYINLWNTTCIGCVEELEEIQAFYDKMKDEIEVFTVATYDTKEAAQQLIEEEGYTFNVLLDQKGDIYESFGFEALPCSIFLNEDGEIVSKIQEELTLDRLYDEYLRVSGKTPTPTPTTTPTPTMTSTPTLKPSPTNSPTSKVTATQTPTKVPKSTPTPTKTTGQSLDFTLQDLNGNEVQLKDFKGKKVFINIWATWCGYCVQEMPDMEKIHQEGDADTVILAVNAGEDLNTVKEFMDSNGFHFTALMDESYSLGKKLNVTGYPTSIFIDREGNISSKVVGAMSYDKMKKELQKIK